MVRGTYEAQTSLDVWIGACQWNEVLSNIPYLYIFFQAIPWLICAAYLWETLPQSGTLSSPSW